MTEISTTSPINLRNRLNIEVNRSTPKKCFPLSRAPLMTASCQKKIHVKGNRQRLLRHSIVIFVQFHSGIKYRSPDSTDAYPSPVGSGPLRPDLIFVPVTEGRVSVLLRPTGWTRIMSLPPNEGILTLLSLLLATKGPAIKAMKTTSKTKYSIAKRMTLRLRSFDCFRE